MKEQHVDALFESMLKDAIGGHLNDIELEATEKYKDAPPICTPAFRAKMNKIVANAEKTAQRPIRMRKRKLIRRFGTVFALVILTTSVIGYLTVDAFRFSINAFFSFSKQADVTIIQDGLEAEKHVDIPDGTHLPIFIPEEYRIYKVYKGPVITTTDFINPGNDHILLEQQTSRKNIYQQNAPEENTQEIQINDSTGKIVTKDDNIEIIWRVGDLDFRLIGKEPQKTLVKMAKSIK